MTSPLNSPRQSLSYRHSPQPVAHTVSRFADHALFRAIRRHVAQPGRPALRVSPVSVADNIYNAVNTLSVAASDAYSTLLPTADVANAVLTSLPAYDLTLFAASLQTGNLLRPSQPIATYTYLIPFRAFEAFAVIGQAETVAVTGKPRPVGQRGVAVRSRRRRSGWCGRSRTGSRRRTGTCPPIAANTGRVPHRSRRGRSGRAPPS